MIWIFRSSPRGFEDLSLAELHHLGAQQFSERFFYSDQFDLSKSAYASFTIREVSRGKTPEEAIQNFAEPVKSPYRVEKIKGTKRKGSQSFAYLAEKHLGGVIQASNPSSIISVFTPDNKIWIAGFLQEKNNSVIEKLEMITERTSVSLTSRAALAMVNLRGNDPIVDPCCGAGLIVFASLLCNNETYGADNNYRMLKLAHTNRDTLNLDISLTKKNALKPWNKDCCLVTDFPAERGWISKTKDISLEIFNAWIPFITSFCVIFPNRVMDQLPKTIIISKKIEFTADRTIITGTINKKT